MGEDIVYNNKLCINRNPTIGLNNRPAGGETPSKKYCINCWEVLMPICLLIYNRRVIGNKL